MCLRRARAGLLLVCLTATGCGFSSARQEGIEVAVESPGAAAAAVVDADALPLRDRSLESAEELSAQARDAAVARDTAPEPEDAEAARDESSREAERTPSAAGGLSVAGLSATQNDSTVDGVSNWQAFGAGPRGATAGGVHAGASFGEGAVRSFRVSPGRFAADAGGAGGAVAVETRAGEMRLHGSVFGLVRESAWAATNPFSQVTRYTGKAVEDTLVPSASTSLVKPEDALGQFGGTLGGPLPRWLLPGSLRGRVQGFGSMEQQVQSNPVVSAPATASFFTLTATQLALLGNRGVSAQGIDAGLRFLDSLMGPVGRSSSRTLWFGRLDTQPGGRDRVTAGWILNRFHAPAGAGFGSASEAVVARGRGSLGDQTVAVDAGTAAWQHVWPRGWGNDLRVQVARDLEYEQPRAPLPQEPAIGPGGSAPEVSIGPDGFAYGTPASLGKTAYPDERRVEVAERLEMVRGRNAVRLGGDWSRLDDTLASVTNADGTFSYESGATAGKAGGLVDWLTDYALGVKAYPNAGCPSVTAAVHRFCFRSFTQSFGAQRTEFVTHEVAAYAEDVLRVGRGLSVTAGVRWEYTLLPLPQVVNPALDAGLRSVLAAGDARAGSTAAFPEDRNNFGPRVSAAWTSRWVTLRAGYGGFFGRVPGATIRAALANTDMPGSVTRVRITPVTETVCPQVPTVAFGLPCDYVATPPAAVLQTARATVFAKNFRVPTVQRFSFGLERSLGRRVDLRFGYAGAVATQLPGSVDLNLVPATAAARFAVQGGKQDGQTFALPLYTARLLTQYGPVSAVTSTANATYHAAEAEVSGRWARVEVRGAYAFSRAIDYGPQLSAAPRVMTQLDPLVDGYDKGRSALDFTHHFAGALVARSKWTRGAAWERAALRDWRLGAIGVAGSGAPYSYEIFGGTYLNGGSESINGAGGATYLPTVGRNTLRLPARGKLDLRLSREVRVRGWRIEGFAEAFNALNTRSLTGVETRAFLPAVASNGVTPLVFQDAATVTAEGITTPAFGTATSSTSGLSRERQVEVGFRASF